MGSAPGPSGAASGVAYAFAANVAFGIMRLQGWRHHVTGLGHVPRTGGAVIAANHTSFWDYFCIGRAPYRELGRPVRILAKASLFAAPVFGALMRASRHIPVERGAGAAALTAAVAALRAGELVLVFPEQTISPTLDLLPFKTGAARMAALAQVPLVPAASFGSHRFHTVGRRPRPIWRLPVVTAFGEPLEPAPDSDPAVVTSALDQRVRALLDQVVTTYPGGTPAGAWWVPASHGGRPRAGAAVEHLGTFGARRRSR